MVYCVYKNFLWEWHCSVIVNDPCISVQNPFLFFNLNGCFMGWHCFQTYSWECFVRPMSTKELFGSYLFDHFCLLQSSWIHGSGILIGSIKKNAKDKKPWSVTHQAQDCPGKNTGVGCLPSLEIFLIQGLNPCLLSWQTNSLSLGRQGSLLPNVPPLAPPKNENEENFF